MEPEASLSYRFVDAVFRALIRVLAIVGGTRIEETQRLNDGRVIEHLGPRLRCHWQNLNDRVSDTAAPVHGRCWFTFYANEKSRARGLQVEWNLWSPTTIFTLGVNVKDHDHDVLLKVGLWPINLYFVLENVFPKTLNAWWHRRYRYADREVGITIRRDVYSVNGGLDVSGKLWVGDEVKRGRSFYFNLPDALLTPIFGRIKHSEEVLDSKPVKIPMPEGEYDGNAKLTRSTWKRPRLPFPSLVREGAHLDIPHGIPFEGKGENSWDCGEDGVFGIGSTGGYDEVIKRAREFALSRRAKYGRSDNGYPPPEVRAAAIEARRAEAESRKNDTGAASS
jgi:hypothetical protein